VNWSQVILATSIVTCACAPGPADNADNASTIVGIVRHNRFMIFNLSTAIPARGPAVMPAPGPYRHRASTN